MAGRLNTNISSVENSNSVEQVFARLIDIRESYDNEAGLARLRQAYEFGRKAHEGKPAKVVSHTLHTPSCCLSVGGNATGH